ncbi:MAG: 50S ribosomal protein L28 [bacterium]
MPNVCAICNKSQVSGNNVSHSKRRTKRVWKPNLTPKKTIANGRTKVILICMRCLKATAKPARQRKVKTAAA